MTTLNNNFVTFLAVHAVTVLLTRPLVHYSDIMSHVTRIERRVSEPNLENNVKQVGRRSRSTALVAAKKENFQLPERLQALLTDDFDHEEFQRKLELLKCI